MENHQRINSFEREWGEREREKYHRGIREQKIYRGPVNGIKYFYFSFGA